MIFDVQPSTADSAEAARRMPQASVSEQNAFAQRQLCARRRVQRLRKFYDQNPCRMSGLHLLTASSVAVARFCGYSAAFHALGEAIMPVDAEGAPKSPHWLDYQQACAAGRPWTHRDELWLAAHAEDWQVVQAAELDAAFFAEAAEHADDPNWRMLLRHADLTFGTRVFEQMLQAGKLPQETIISLSLGLSLRRALRQGWPLIGRYIGESLRAILWSPRETRADFASYRQIGWLVLKSLFTSGRTWKVYRRGLRIQNRGIRAPEVEWPLLETLLGDDVHQVHPLIVQFYRNPGRFAATASLDIRTLPLMIYSRMAALLLGQGLYEGGAEPIPARLHVFQRADGSMHFVRELDCGATMRVFDSDFVLRKGGDENILVEVFGEIGVEVVLEAQLRPDRGVAVVGRDIYWRGVRLPRTALRIEFVSRVCTDDAGVQFVEVTGRLDMAPRSSLGRFVMHTLLRRPKQLGSIQYILRLLG